MKVVSFRSYFHPEIAASMYLMQNLAEDMAQEGIEVELFVPMPSRGIDAETKNKYKKIKYEEHFDGKLKVHRFAMLPEGKGTIGRALRYFLLNLAFVWKGLWCKADVFFIDSTPPTQGIMATFVKKIKKVPIVYNLQDIFPDSLVHTGISTEDSFAFKIGKWMEKVTYKNSDIIIAISEDFKENIMEKGVPEDKIEVVYNWVDEMAVQKVEREDNTLFDKYGLERDKFYIAYSGNIGLTQNMELLVEVADRLRNNSKIRFVIVGDGSFKKTLEELILERHLNNIDLIPFQPYEDIANVFSLGNMGLIISKPGVANNSVPSKTWSYMSAGIPLLTSFDIDSELVMIVEKNDCGYCAKAGVADELLHVILSAFENNDSLYQKGQNGRKFIELNLSRKVGTHRYIEVFENVGGKNAHIKSNSTNYDENTRH